MPEYSYKERLSQSWQPMDLNSPNSHKPSRLWKQQAPELKWFRPTEKRLKAGITKIGVRKLRLMSTLKSADPAHYDALLLPGGVMNPDQLRMNPDAVKFVKQLLSTREAGGSDLPRSVDAGGNRRGPRPHHHILAVAENRHSSNAGGTWVDEEVVLSNGVVTSRKPDDIPAFNRK
jgi:protease I